MTAAASPSGRIAVVVKGYPRLSETFIAQEILGLQRRGLDLTIVSLRHPTDRDAHAINKAITAPVLYLPEYLHNEPRRVFAGWRRARRLPGYRRARGKFLADLRRDPTRNRVRRFGQACVLAAELPADIGWIYSHYLHTPASVTRYAAEMAGLGWSVSGHAKDIWTTPDWDLREKLTEAAWVVTCTAINRDHLAKLAPSPDKVTLVYHGLDFSRFPAATPRPPRTGATPDDPVRLITVGRAVAKKGYDVLLDALARLPADLHWHWTQIGGGPLLDRLKAQGRQLGLDDRIVWRGALAQDAVIAALQDADLFILAAKVAADGDRDGLPNVLMEAQATGLPCLATRLSAIPELIEDRETGILVPPDDPAAMAAALAELVADPALRDRLAQAGARRVRRDFAFDRGLDTLTDRLGPDRPLPEARRA